MQDLSKKYKNKWIGEIPENWEVKKLPWVCFFQEGPGLRNWQFVEEDGVPVVCVSNITLKGLDFKKFKRYISKEEYLNSYQHFRVRKNDLLLTSSGSIGKICKYKGEFDFEFILNTSTIRLHSLDENLFSTDFIKYLITSDIFQNQLNLLITGSAQSNFGPSHLNQVRIPIPSSKEQKIISQYLDKKTQQIDSLIEKIEKKIELLKEQKTTLINQFVTKGLDTNVEMKDSGFECIGEIPKHWITSKLKYITSRIGDGLHSTPNYVEDSQYHFINGNNLIDGEITIFPSTRCVSQDEYKKYLIELNQNCILLSINGTIGNLALYKGEGIILGKSCCYIKLKNLSFRDYYYWFLKSNFVFNYFRKQLSGTTILNLSLESIRDTNILIPPIKEQEEISKILKKEYEKFTELTKKHFKKIKLLKEYRQSLITSLVTGKIRITEHMV